MFCTAVVGSYYSLSNVTMKISEGCRSLVSRCLQVFSNNKMVFFLCVVPSLRVCQVALAPCVCENVEHARTGAKGERIWVNSPRN